MTHLDTLIELKVKYQDKKRYLSKLLGKYGDQLINLKILQSYMMREGLQPITALLPSPAIDQSEARKAKLQRMNLGQNSR